MELSLKSLFHVPAALLLIDADLKPLSCSRKGFSVFGIRSSPDSFEKGLATLEENLKGERAFVANLQSAVSRVRRPGSEEQFRWDRGERIYDVTVGALTLAGDAGYVVLFHDETQQTRFEETQELARRYLEDILNNIQLGVVVLNREMRITNMNRAQEAFLHRLGTWTSWVESIGTPISELWLEDSEQSWEEITKKVLTQGETYGNPRRHFETPEGDLVLSVEITPLKDQNGEMIGAIQVAEDVTDRVRLEEELREAEIVAERLEAVRQTAITVNHEVNNPLTTILATAQMLRMWEGSREEVHEKLAQIEQDAKRIGEVTKRLQLVEEVKTKDYIKKGPKMLDLGLE